LFSHEAGSGNIINDDAVNVIGEQSQYGCAEIFVGLDFFVGEGFFGNDLVGGADLCADEQFSVGFEFIKSIGFVCANEKNLSDSDVGDGEIYDFITLGNSQIALTVS